MLIVRILLVIVGVGLHLLEPASALAERMLVTGSSPNDGGAKIRIVNPLTGATITETSVTMASFTVQGIIGLARDPGTGIIYVLLRVQGAPNCVGDRGRVPELATLDLRTGADPCSANET